MKNNIVIGLILLLLVSCAPAKETEKVEEPETVEEVEESKRVWSDHIEDEWYMFFGISSQSKHASMDGSGNFHFELNSDEIVIKRNEPFEYYGKTIDCTWLDAPNDGTLVILHDKDEPCALYFAKEADSFSMYEADFSTSTVLFNNGQLLSNQSGETQDISYQCTDNALYLIIDKQYINFPIHEYNDNIIMFTIDLGEMAKEYDVDTSDFFGGFVRKSAIK